MSDNTSSSTTSLWPSDPSWKWWQLIIICWRYGQLKDVFVCLWYSIVYTLYISSLLFCLFSSYFYMSTTHWHRFLLLNVKNKWEKQDNGRFFVVDSGDIKISLFIVVVIVCMCFEYNHLSHSIPCVHCTLYRLTSLLRSNRTKVHIELSIVGLHAIFLCQTWQLIHSVEWALKCDDVGTTRWLTFAAFDIDNVYMLDSSVHISCVWQFIASYHKLCASHKSQRNSPS